MEIRSHGAAHGDVEAVNQEGEGMVVKLGALSVNIQTTSSMSASTTTTDFRAIPRATAHGATHGSVESGSAAGFWSSDYHHAKRD